MTKSFFFIGLALSACAAQKAKPIVADPTSERRVAEGTLVGKADGEKLHAWLGIPYAAPPVSALRWRAPRPALKWSGRRETLRFGAVCPQFGGPMSGVVGAKEDQVIGSEDCLTLNIFAPRFAPSAVPAGAARRPVMFWIHGGGNSIGSSILYEGAKRLAEAFGVIMVTTNYRLGVLGWFFHPALHGTETSAEDRSGNYGTLDLIAALRWVKANIAAFGGDPDNITVFGESAGGMNIFSLLVAPAAKGLFQKAIIQSGLPTSASQAEALHFKDDPEPGNEASAQEVLLRLLQQDKAFGDAIKQRGGDPRSAAKRRLVEMSDAEIAALLRGASAEAMLRPLAGSPWGMYRVPNIIRDGMVIPNAPITSLLAKPGAHHAMPIILGTNRDEYKLFLLGDDAYVSRFLGIPRIRDDATYERAAAAISGTWKVLGADNPARALLTAGETAVFVYRFDWDEGKKNLFVDLGKLIGAGHGVEVPFVFLDADNDFFGLVSSDNRAGRRAVSEAMAAYWVNFARTGAPAKGGESGLPVWQDAQKGFMVFASPAHGGARMAGEWLTIDALVQRLFAESGAAPLKDDDRRERCRVAATMLWLLKRSGERGDYHQLAQGRCDGFDLRALAAKAK